MKLTSQQIERLYQFTRQHYVEWYDLQSELVDHLANAIEAQWQENPKISIEDALQVEFKKFGVFGFMDVVEERQIALGKKYNKLVWQHLKSFFTLPKIIGTATAFGVLFAIMQKFQFAYIVIITLLIATSVVFWIILIKMSNKNKKQAKLSGKKWLYKDIIFGFGSYGGLSYLPIQLAIQLGDKIEYSFVTSILVSISVVLILLYNYIVLKIIPSKAEVYLKETYPEYSLSMQLH